tara:strand:- start:57 stop:581 length:525 start_codon:yes stop_codon:yes gene_type:complete
MNSREIEREIDEVLAGYADQLDEGSSGIGYHLDYLEGIDHEQITTSLIFECMNSASKSTSWDRNRHHLCICIPLSDCSGTDIFNYPPSLELAVQENLSCSEPPSIVLCLRSDYINGLYSGISFKVEIADEHAVNMTNRHYALQYIAWPFETDDLADSWSRCLVCIYHPDASVPL